MFLQKCLGLSFISRVEASKLNAETFLTVIDIQRPKQKARVWLEQDKTVGEVQRHRTQRLTFDMSGSKKAKPF
jgi:hypothetical protein